MLEIKIDTASPGPLYQQIVEQIKDLISRGLLKPGEQIPSVRDLATWLKLNPSTVARAYYDLKQQGLVVASRRRGTVITGNGHAGECKIGLERRERSNTLADVLTHGPGPSGIETAFTLQPSYWRVQRPE